MKQEHEKKEEEQETLKIVIVNNAIRFVTPQGKTYFKNLENFKVGLDKGQKTFRAWEASPGVNS